MSKSLSLTLSFLSLLLLSLWFMHVLTRHPISHSSSPTVITAFAENVFYTSYSKKGLRRSQIQAIKLTRQQNGISSFQYPHGVIYTKRRIPWYIRANKGKSRKGGDWIKLMSNVMMHQLPYPHHPETIIKTEAATIYPQQQTAKTDLAVTIQQQDNQVDGIGMIVDLDKGVINILSHSKGYYRPAQPKRIHH